MPGDLNLKKSWNPALVKNQNKLWQQEQKSLEEYKKIKEREKELEKEQEDKKLLSLKTKFNTLTKADKLKLNKLDWMYNDGPSKTQSETTRIVNTPVVNKDDKRKDNNDPMAKMMHRVAKPNDNTREGSRKDFNERHGHISREESKDTDRHSYRDSSRHRSSHSKEGHHRHKHRHHRRHHRSDKSTTSDEKKPESRNKFTDPEKSKQMLQY